jgi:hypothetical protein
MHQCVNLSRPKQPGFFYATAPLFSGDKTKGRPTLANVQMQNGFSTGIQTIQMGRSLFRQPSKSGRTISSRASDVGSCCIAS